MNVLISGSTGLVGSALVSALTADGQQVARLARRRGNGALPEVLWDPAGGTIDGDALEAAGPFDAVVHLAGESIAAGRWTPEQKARIRDSRVRGTRVLASALSRLPAKPAVFACASAVGFYGNRGDEVLTEASPAGSGYLASVCREWEAAARPATDAGIRVSHLRLGPVLSREGGALTQMVPVFKMGAGGPLGSGRQWMSWVDLTDVVGAFRHVLETVGLSGPVNLVAPNPVTNRDFTRALGRALGRPAIVPAPAFALRMLMGEMADALLLSGQRVLPTRLQETGYRFQYSQLEDALRHALAK